MTARHARGLPGAVALAVLALVLGAERASAQLLDEETYTFTMFERLEYVPGSQAEPVRYDVTGWHGGDFTRLWFKAEGQQGTVGDHPGETELQLLYGRLVMPFWDLQAGLRLDARYGDGTDRTRGLLAVGLQGLAPYRFEVEATGFVSHDGDVSASLETSYDLFVTQRLVGQPRAEVSVAVQEVPEFGMGSGLGELELGWRVRYELRREVAPYGGVSWGRKFGGTADLARSEGEEAAELSVVAGLRAWF